MPLFNENSPMEYDAIVVGTGISGGWAAKELAEKGLKTLVLERGRNVNHVVDYKTMNDDPWDLPNNDRPTQEMLKDYPMQNRTGYTVRPSHVHWFVKDTEHPYYEKPDTRFDWIRGYHVGGRSLVWGRQSYRLADLDFEANAKQGIAVDWPIRYKDLAPWYSHVEKFAGISGQKEGIKHLPDGEFLPPMELNCVEEELKKSINSSFPERHLTIGRTAHITGDSPFQNRGTCQSRNRCMRGCPYGAYFSSNASTLPAAEASGNMTLRPDSIVTEVIYDAEKGKASGVRVMDSNTKEVYDFKARIIFLNASAIATTAILMNSKSDRFPNGMGNDSGELGHNIMDHHFRVGASGDWDGFEDKYYKGRRPNGFYIPRFRNLDEKTKMPDFVRGYGFQGSASREDWSAGVAELGIGGGFKDSLMKPGGWRAGMTAFGEILPYHDNAMELNYDKLDAWGQPTITFSTTIRENELNMRKDMAVTAGEMLEAAGFKNISTWDDGYGVGLGIHEMGTARMGKDPKTSVLNKWNQIHAVPNVFVTDGACMTSAACQNPSLTYMALTARAANYAVDELKKMNL
ncbi:MAG: GMC family oxidoreductase [Saprospiraceae bacterium]|nr:GMC family oxidoreductase [Saprospiraceae bacterium]